MKVKVIACDRCNTTNREGLEMFVLSLRKPGVKGAPPERYDLCLNCKKELKAWVKP